MRKILSCIFSILLCSGGLAAQDTSGAVTADTTTVSEAKKPRRVDTIPWERSGLRVGIDVLKPILSFVNNQPQGAEISLDYEVKKNYFGVLEAGYQQMELDEIRYNYNYRGMFGRLGIDYNFMKRRQSLSSEMAYVGFRCGFSSFSLQADSVLLRDSSWGVLMTSFPTTH